MLAGTGYNLLGPSSELDWWIKKFDSNGIEDNTDWDKKYNTIENDFAYSVTIDSKNNVYVVGYGEIYVDNYWRHYAAWIKKFLAQ